MGEEMKINCGVPQGSVMGPLLFILYISSICDMIIDGQIVKFADDTCLLFSGVSWDEVRVKAIQDFKKVINYLNHRKLTINYKKTNLINFTINKDDKNFDNLEFNIYDNGSSCNVPIYQKIYRVSSIRYLGLTFDKNMKWNLHVNNIVMRMRLLSFSFYKLQSFLPVQTMHIIYLSLFQAILQYSLLVWGELNQNSSRPLQLLQKKKLLGNI